MLDGDATVSLKDARQARTDMERLICQIVGNEGPQTVTHFVDRIAERIYLEELRHGAWTVGIGLLGPSLFHEEAMALLETMAGRCLAVEGETDK